MKKVLPLVSAATVFLFAVVAVGEHAQLIREGYRLSEREKVRDRLLVETARAHERVSRLSSPELLAERAREFGLPARYPRTYPVVRVAPRTGATQEFVARWRSRAGDRSRDTGIEVWEPVPVDGR